MINQENLLLSQKMTYIRLNFTKHEMLEDEEYLLSEPDKDTTYIVWFDLKRGKTFATKNGKEIMILDGMRIQSGIDICQRNYDGMI